ncbi:putative DNA binding protein [Pelagibacter phage HTVC100P]|nr:putative DNA binding protein [Pelagibacter phage HTVC100P]
MKFYGYLKKNPELEIKITEARKYGVQTLIDKLLQVFKYQEIEDPNAILWIREKTKFITFLANKLTDLYSDNKPIKQNIDQKMTISWEDTQDDLIDVSEDIVDIPSDNKD